MSTDDVTNEMSETNEISAMLRGAFAPFDAKAWERFRDWDPTAAAYLYDAVASGASAEQIKDYGEAHGYFPSNVSWLARAAAWLQQVRDDPETAAVRPEPSRKRIHDAAPEPVALRPPARSCE